MPVKRRKDLAETSRRSYYKEEWLEEFLDSKKVHFAMVMKVIIMNSSSYWRILPIVAAK